MNNLPLSMNLAKAIGDSEREIERLAFGVNTIVSLRARHERQILVRVRPHVDDVDFDVGCKHVREIMKVFAEGRSFKLPRSNDVELKHFRRVVKISHDFLKMRRE